LNSPGARRSFSSMRIVCIRGDEKRTFMLDKDQVVIGRRDPNSQADLQLEFDSSISRMHLRATLESGQIYVEDLGSSWGSKINGQPVNERTRLTVDDEIEIGNTIVKISPPPAGSTVWLNLDRRQAASFSDDELPTDVTVDSELSPVESMDNVERDTVHMSKKQLAVLFELPQHFAGEPTKSSLAELVLDRALQIIPGAQRGAVLVRDRSTNDKFAVVASRPADDPPVSHTLVKRCVANRVGFIWSREQEMDPSESMSRLGLETGIYAPLVWLEQVVGVVCIDSMSANRSFSRDDLGFLMTVANYAGAALLNLMLRQDLEQSLAMSQQLLASVAKQSARSSKDD
jgi:pSer/pThr/pTyr-binding forkhead associated (FHA) protein